MSPSSCPRYAAIIPLHAPDRVAESAPAYSSNATSAAGSPITEPPVIELDAFELHRRIVGFQRLSDRFRLEHLKLLAVLDDGHRYVELGYSSTKQYLIRELNVGRSSALELIRVARRLHELPRLATALGEGEIRWSTMKCVSRVATEETETEWLRFATEHTLEQTQHEVKRAIAEQRDRPAEPSEFGLPNVMSRVSFELTLDEKERFHTALATVAEVMGPGAPTDVASVVTYLSQRILEGDLVGAPADGGTVSSGDGADRGSEAVSTDRQSPRGRAPGITVVYHRYADGGSTVDTPDGPVQVDADVVDRIQDVAETVTLTAADVAEATPLVDGEIDLPNSSTLANKVRKRDGERCANPGCGRRDTLQAHHVHFRSQGGPTALSNEVTLCRSCHALVHAGLVTIERRRHGGWVWVPRARTIHAIPLVELFPPLAGLGARPAPPVQCGHAGGADAGAAVGCQPLPDLPDLDGLIDGLTSLGYSKQEARRRLDAAVAKLTQPPDSPDPVSTVDDEAVLREALRSSA